MIDKEKLSFCDSSLLKIESAINMLIQKRSKADDSLSEILTEIIESAEFEKKCLLIFKEDPNENLTTCEGYIEHMETKLASFALPII